MTTHSSYPESTRLTQAAEDAARQTSRTAQQGLERVSESLGEASAQTGEAFRNLAHSTEELAHRGMDVVRDKTMHVRDTTTHYIQDEPVKSMLIAAAVGAALMGLVAMFSRSDSTHAHNGYRSHR
jgi:ElaB/YqjD/DUF883 family membrane-anchored ribosome-binding protein